MKAKSASAAILALSLTITTSFCFVAETSNASDQTPYQRKDGSIIHGTINSIDTKTGNIIISDQGYFLSSATIIIGPDGLRVSIAALRPGMRVALKRQGTNNSRNASLLGISIIPPQSSSGQSAR